MTWPFRREQIPQHKIQDPAITAIHTAIRDLMAAITTLAAMIDLQQRALEALEEKIGADH
jgi:hypothetical protein